MKIIFLDIDGVLNHETFYRWRQEQLKTKTYPVQYPFNEFCPENIELLNQLIEITGAKVVVSSTWRHGRTIEQLQEILNVVGFKGEIIDATPSIYANTKHLPQGYTIPRGCEIDYWLDQKKFQRINWSREKQLEYLQNSEVKNYVILDDDSDMLYGQREHFVKCNAYKKGFDEDCLQKAIEILSMDLVELYYQDSPVFS